MAKTQALNATQRKQLIDSIVSNCGCKAVQNWKPEDRPVLEATDDARLVELETNAQAVAKMSLVANAAVEGVRHGDIGFRFDLEQGQFVVNAFPPQGGDDEEEEDEEDDDKKKGKMPPQFAQNSRTPERPATKKKLSLNDLPPDVKRMVANAQKIEAKAVAGYITTITANANNTFTKEGLIAIASRDGGVEQLEAMAKLAGGPTANELPFYTPPNFLGAAPAVNAELADNEEDDSDMATPSLNWADMAAKRDAARRA